VLPATLQRWHSCPYSSRSWYLIKRPRRDARLSWPSTHMNTSDTLHIGKGACEWTLRNSKLMQTFCRFLQRCGILFILLVLWVLYFTVLFDYFIDVCSRCVICSVFTARCHASAVLATGLCLCLSDTSRSSTKTAKRRITQTTPHDSPGTLVFWSQRSPRNSTGVTLCGSAKCRCGGSKSRFQLTRRIARSLGDSWASCYNTSTCTMISDWLWRTCISLSGLTPLTYQ